MGTPDATPYVPQCASLTELRDAVQRCRGCDLYRHATQAVLGEGRAHARIVLVGEQPGDKEDLSGHPFVGPAGRLLDRALEEAGIARQDVYVTNAMKHFKFEERGKRPFTRSRPIKKLPPASLGWMPNWRRSSPASSSAWAPPRPGR